MKLSIFLERTEIVCRNSVIFLPSRISRDLWSRLAKSMEELVVTVVELTAPELELGVCGLAPGVAGLGGGLGAKRL